MKYCSKCGNALNDDMAFCPKCGEACIEQPTSPADQKLRDLESIHIILPKEELSWEYIRTHKDIGAILQNKKVSSASGGNRQGMHDSRLNG